MSDAGPTRAVKVTLFEDRAEVVRSGRVALSPGVQWVRLAGVTPYVDDRSLQARVDGEALVVSARVARIVHYEPAAGREHVDALEDAERTARRAAEAAERRVERAHADEARLRQMIEQWGAAVAHAPRWLSDPARLAEWRASYDELERAGAAAQDEIVAARAAAVRAEEERQRAQVRLAEGLVATPRHETLVEVQIDARAAGEAGVEITYRTPCAVWRPEHLARLEGDRVELVTWGTVWQHTGEAWDDVELVLSTARPGRSASPPHRIDDVLQARRKSDEDRRRVVVDAREQTVAVTGATGARAVDEMPGVDDGGEPLSFAAARRVSVASDGRPFRVEIGRRSFDARVARVLYPERAPVAHLRALATLGGGGPLLAGPLRVARGGGLVGRAKVDFVAAGEPFELGFGPDDGVRVRRRVDASRDTTAIAGTQVLSRTVKIYLSNLSDESKRVEVVERVPVSEIEDVEVLRPTGGWTFDGKDGFARREIELAPQGTETLELAYTIRAAAKVQLPF